VSLHCLSPFPPRRAGRSPQRRSKSGLADIARPTEQKKGADKGIDGRIYFHDEAAGGKTKQVILSVKEGIRVQRMFETSAASSIGRRERLESSFPCRCRPLR
jgi:hypothetical protein